MNQSKRNIVVFSGGSAANNLVDVFGKLAGDKGCGLSYVIPISDNGGSSSELIRVFGGPGIGDVRSRLIRLIPESPLTPSTTALKTLFAHRLSPLPHLARSEWHTLLEGTHPLWLPIPSHKRELIRSYLNTINLEILKRVRPSSSFNFQSASVGNLFLTGARLFTGSFESAIYLLGAIGGVGEGTEVVPAINSNFSHHISAGLEDGTVITGQNAISHPSAPSAPTPAPTPSPLATEQTFTSSSSVSESINGDSITGQEILSPNPIEPVPIPKIMHTRTLSIDHDHETEQIEDANPPFSLPTLRSPNITFHKTHTPALPSPISRIWYINPYGQEIRPSPNPKVLSCLEGADTVIYSIGSLYTSIIPCLILREVGEKIRGLGVRWKVLILNGSLDRETRSIEKGEYSATDFVRAIVEAGRSSRKGWKRGEKMDEGEVREYVTHMVHLVGEGTPRVDRQELGKLGVETVRIYGRRGGDGGMVYDGTALGQALRAVIGGGSGAGGGKGVDRSRRNTLNLGG